MQLLGESFVKNICLFLYVFMLAQNSVLLYMQVTSDIFLFSLPSDYPLQYCGTTPNFDAFLMVVLLMQHNFFFYQATVVKHMAPCAAIRKYKTQCFPSVLDQAAAPSPKHKL